MPLTLESTVLLNLQGAGGIGAVSLDCAPKSAGGIRRVWAGDRETFGTWQLEETATLQYGRITGSSVAGLWYPLAPQWQTAGYSEVQEPLPARGYAVTLRLPYTRMSLSHRDTFERFAFSNRCVFAVEDTNGDGWLVGEDAGCLVTTNFDTQTAAGVATYNIVAEARQTWPIRQLHADFLQAIGTPVTTTTGRTFRNSGLAALANENVSQILLLLKG